MVTRDCLVSVVKLNSVYILYCQHNKTELICVLVHLDSLDFDIYRKQVSDKCNQLVTYFPCAIP